jgi:hypothetical protein
VNSPRIDQKEVEILVTLHYPHLLALISMEESVSMIVLDKYLICKWSQRATELQVEVAIPWKFFTSFELHSDSTLASADALPSVAVMPKRKLSTVEGGRQTVTVKLADVPEYLRSGELFKSMQSEEGDGSNEDEEIEVPVNCVKRDESVSSVDDAWSLLHSLRYWIAGSDHPLPAQTRRAELTCWSTTARFL